jgi:hypothetical protein
MQTKNQVPDFEHPNKERIEAVVYDIVSKTFRMNTEHNLKNDKPNAKDIAEKFGCELEFRVSELPENSHSRITKRKKKPKICKLWDIEETGRIARAKSLILKGENYNQLMQAVAEIHRIYGEGRFDNGLVYHMPNLPETFIIGTHLRTNRYN